MESTRQVTEVAHLREDLIRDDLGSGAFSLMFLERERMTTTKTKRMHVEQHSALPRVSCTHQDRTVMVMIVEHHDENNLAHVVVADDDDDDPHHFNTIAYVQSSPVSGPFPTEPA